jgi:DNA mismatch repair protein PMS2
VADVTIVTRNRSDPLATKLEFDESGSITAETSVSRPVGTTVTVTGLFRRFPVRYQEFRKNAKKDFAKVVQLIRSYALICTGVRIKLHTTATGSNNKE